LPLLGVDLLGLLIDHLHDLLVAIARVVSGRPAGEILVEVGVGIVGADSREVRAELVLLAGGQGMPLAVSTCFSVASTPTCFSSLITNEAKST